MVGKTSTVILITLENECPEIKTWRCPAGAENSSVLTDIAIL